MFEKFKLIVYCPMFNSGIENLSNLKNKKKQKIIKCKKKNLSYKSGTTRKSWFKFT